MDKGQRIVIVFLRLKVLYRVKRIYFFYPLYGNIRCFIGILQNRFIIIHRLSTLKEDVGRRRLVIHFALFRRRSTNNGANAGRRITQRLSSTIGRIIIRRVFTSLLLYTTAMRSTKGASSYHHAIKDRPYRQIRGGNRIYLTLQDRRADQDGA